MFPHLYRLTSLILLLIQLAFLGMLAYTKVMFGMVPYFGIAGDEPPGFEKYFTLLYVLLIATFLFIFLWAIMTPAAVLWNRRSRVEEERIDLVKGGVGFVLAVLLILLDPFGVFRHLTTSI